MPTPFSALLFDMDGLMIDTEAISARAWQEAATLLALPLEDRHLHAMVGLSMTRCQDYLTAELGADAAQALDKVGRQRYHQQLASGPIPLKPGIIELLDWSIRHPLQRAVGTATRRELATLKLTRTGLADYFRHVVTCDDVAHTKPAPDVYLEAAKRLALAPADCIVLEDSPHGAAAALAAGMRVIIVPDLAPPPPHIAKQALAVCKSLHEAKQLLAGLLSHPH